MKILALSNYYPPFEIGGEELSAQAIVNGLREHGHHVEVLTSNVGGEADEPYVQRELMLEMETVRYWNSIRFFTDRAKIIEHDIQCVRNKILRLKPDLILIFSLWNIPRQLPEYIESNYGHQVIYRLASYWPLLPSQHQHYWQAPGRSLATKVIKKLFGYFALNILKNDPLPSLRLQHSICISQAVYDEFARQGKRLEEKTIIHNGINIEPFIRRTSPWERYQSQEGLRLLYVGRMSPEKGVQTAIEALGLIATKDIEISLTIAGPLSEGTNNLTSLVKNLELVPKVKFLGKVTNENIPELMSKHHVLIVPSIWQEPFGRVVLEGMAGGLVVVGTGQGGMSVALRHEQSGLQFPSQDAAALAAQILRLRDDPALGKRLSQNARDLVASQFTEKQMVAAYEKYLVSFFSSLRFKVPES